MKCFRGTIENVKGRGDINFIIKSFCNEVNIDDYFSNASCYAHCDKYVFDSS